jgi:hypothetical protein
VPNDDVMDVTIERRIPVRPCVAGMVTPADGCGTEVGVPIRKKMVLPIRSVSDWITPASPVMAALTWLLLRYPITANAATPSAKSAMTTYVPQRWHLE